METLYTIEETAKLLKVHSRTIRRYIKDGKLAVIKIVGSVRIKESEIKRLRGDE